MEEQASQLINLIIIIAGQIIAVILMYHIIRSMRQSFEYQPPIKYLPNGYKAWLDTSTIKLPLLDTLLFPFFSERIRKRVVVRYMMDTIIEAWKHLGLCDERKTLWGKVNNLHFESAVMTEDEIQLKLRLTTFEQGKVKVCLPSKVDVQSLICPATLKYLSAFTSHTITSPHNLTYGGEGFHLNNGVWIIVHKHHSKVDAS